MNQPPLDPRTPVVVGVGQASERLDAQTYRQRSPVDLAADAARDALADTGADPSNRDSNKGILSNRYGSYTPLLEAMKQLNERTYTLVAYFDQESKRENPPPIK